jgi:hypothetical protein
MTSTPTLTNTIGSYTPTPTYTHTPTVTATFTVTATATLSPMGTVGSGGNCPGFPQWSGNSLNYAIGQQVSYNGDLYQCVVSYVSTPLMPPSADGGHWRDMGPCSGTPTSGGKPVIGPNPVTSGGQTTGLWVTLSSNSTVKVKIFSLSFREVRTEVFDHVSSGQTELTIDLHDRSGMILSNGLYYVEVDAAGMKSVVKLLILR